MGRGTWEFCLAFLLILCGTAATTPYGLCWERSHIVCFLKNFKTYYFGSLPQSYSLNRLMKHYHPPVQTYNLPFIIILTFLRSYLFLPSTDRWVSSVIQNEKAKWQQMSNATVIFFQTKHQESKAIKNFIFLCPSIYRLCPPCSWSLHGPEQHALTAPGTQHCLCTCESRQSENTHRLLSSRGL